jgi:hypothetical protein
LANEERKSSALDAAQKRPLATILAAVAKLTIFTTGLSINWQTYSALPAHDGAPIPMQFLVPIVLGLGALGTSLTIRNRTVRKVGYLLYLVLAALLFLLFVGTFGSAMFGAADWPYDHPDSQLTYRGWVNYMNSFIRLWVVTLLLIALTDIVLAIYHRIVSRGDPQKENP